MAGLDAGTWAPSEDTDWETTTGNLASTGSPISLSGAR
jgi:hypothetical protein